MKILSGTSYGTSLCFSFPISKMWNILLNFVMRIKWATQHTARDWKLANCTKSHSYSPVKNFNVYTIKFRMRTSSVLFLRGRDLFSPKIPWPKGYTFLFPFHRHGVSSILPDFHCLILFYLFFCLKGCFFILVSCLVVEKALETPSPSSFTLVDLWNAVVSQEDIDIFSLLLAWIL